MEPRSEDRGDVSEGAVDFATFSKPQWSRGPRTAVTTTRTNRPGTASGCRNGAAVRGPR